MKIRTKKVLSLLLAASMVLGMNTMAFGDEIAEVADTATEGAKVTATTAGSDNGIGGGGFLQGSDGKFITTVAYNPESSKKKAKNNLAVITNTTDPVSWNNLYGATLISTVLFGGEADDEYLNNTDKLKVSKNEVPDDSNFPNNVIEGDDYYADSWIYRSVPVDQSAGVYALVGYKFDDEDAFASYDDEGDFDGITGYVKGEYEYKGKDVDPFNIGFWFDRGRISRIPVTEWTGRTIGLNKNGNGKYDADKKNIKNIDVEASLVKFENGTVTELEDLDVKSIKWKDKKALKQASVKLEYANAKVTAKDTKDWEGKDVEGYVKEHDVIGTLPEFTIKVKAKNKDAKKYKKSFKNTIEKESFKVGILQKGIEVWDVTEDDLIETEFIANGVAHGHWTEATKAEELNKAIKASSNGTDFDKMVKDINEAYQSAKEGKSTLKPKAGYVGGLTVTKFDAKKSAKGTIVLRNDIVKDGKVQAGKTADVTLKKGKDYDFESGTLAGETVYVLDLKGDNYVYANTVPDYGEEDLSAFGFKWAFRVDPKDKKSFRYGIFADTNTGFVFGK